MKKIYKSIAAITLSAVSVTATGILASGCGSYKNYVNGPEYEYRVLPSADEYEFTGNPTSGAVADAGVIIDGEFNEAFYKDRKWFKGNKIYGAETGTMEVTTYFAQTGIVVAAKVHDSRPAVHSSWVETGNVTCFNCYFAFGDATIQTDGLYEIECTAGNRFKISQFTPAGLKVINPEFDVTPLTAVKRDGDIKAGECHDYSIEYFMPYALFGKDSRPEKVYLNPTMISSTLDSNGNYLARTWYNFGYEQSSEISSWGNPNQGYIFDAEGFISNDITIQATGGTVTEEWGYDWCLTGDTVNFKVTPDSGKVLSKITVNGENKTSAVKSGILSVTCKGDIDIKAVFVDSGTIVAPDCNSTVTVVDKDGQKVDLGNDAKLTLTDSGNSSQTYTVALTKNSDGTYAFSGQFLPGHYNLSLSVNGYICTSAGKDENNSPTTQLWIDEEGGLLWSVTFTQSAEVSATATLTSNPTANVDIAADVTDGNKTYKVLAWERYGGGDGAEVGTANKAIATSDPDNLLDGTNWKTTAYSSSGSFGNRGYELTGGSGIIAKSCFYLDNGTVSVKLTNKVQQIRLYVGAWSGQEGKFTLKTADGKELVSYTYTNSDGLNDILIIDLDTSVLSDGEVLNCSLVFERLNTGHMPCAGIQLLGENE